MIKPTVGRVVLFHPGPNDAIQCDRSQPLAAIVAYVHNDRLVNLTVSDINGGTHPRPEIVLIQDDDKLESPQSYCEWMEYQKGQAAKAEANLQEQIQAVVMDVHRAKVGPFLDELKQLVEGRVQALEQGFAAMQKPAAQV